MKAITLYQPMAQAIATGPKRIENRKWRPSEAMIGQRIAIHAGRTRDESHAQFIRGLGYECVDEGDAVLGMLIATATLAAAFKGEIAGLAGGWLPDEWWMGGPCGWVLENVAPLERPIQCRGAMGLWEIPEAPLAALLAQIGDQA